MHAIFVTTALFLNFLWLTIYLFTRSKDIIRLDKYDSTFIAMVKFAEEKVIYFPIKNYIKFSVMDEGTVLEV